MQFSPFSQLLIPSHPSLSSLKKESHLIVLIFLKDVTNAQNDLLQFLWTGTNSLHLSREITVKNSLWTKLNLFSLHYFITSSCSKHTRCIACLRRLQLTFIWPEKSGSRGLMDRRNKFRQTIKFVRMSKCLPCKAILWGNTPAWPLVCILPYERSAFHQGIDCRLHLFKHCYHSWGGKVFMIYLKVSFLLVE